MQHVSFSDTVCCDSAHFTEISRSSSFPAPDVYGKFLPDGRNIGSDIKNKTDRVY